MLWLICTFLEPFFVKKQEIVPESKKESRKLNKEVKTPKIKRPFCELKKFNEFFKDFYWIYVNKL